VNKLELNYLVNNPYKSDTNTPAFSPHSAFLNDSPSPQSIAVAPIQALTNAAKMGLAYYEGDEETFIDTAGKVAKAIDNSLIFVTVATHIASFAERVIQKALHSSQTITIFSVVNQILALPLGIAFAILAVIEAVYEGVNFARCYSLMSKLSGSDVAQEKKVVANLTKIHQQYFALDKAESSRITTFIEKHFDQYTEGEKAQKYEEISAKLISVKYADLARRISPHFSEEIATDLQSVIQGLQSDSRSERLESLEKGRELLQTVSTQCKKKLLVHFVALTAIVASMLSIAALCLGFGGVAFIAALTALGILLSITHYAIEKGLLSQRDWNFSIEAAIPGFVKTILCINSSEASLGDSPQKQVVH
jgi:hypothetical protein